MKKLCYVTTVSVTIKAFVLPVLKQLCRNTDWEVTVICDQDPNLAELLPEGVRYIPIPMERGISLGGLGACWKMYEIFRKEKFDLVTRRILFLCWLMAICSAEMRPWMGFPVLTRLLSGLKTKPHSKIPGM